MKFRIVVWATAGVAVAAFWAAYFYPTATNIIANQPAMWTLARVSCPVVFAGFHYGFGVSIGWVLLTNAVTYALLGVAVETLRRQFRTAT